MEWRGAVLVAIGPTQFKIQSMRLWSLGADLREGNILGAASQVEAHNESARHWLSCHHIQ
jgi:hypothetical protein